MQRFPVTCARGHERHIDYGGCVVSGQMKMTFCRACGDACNLVALGDNPPNRFSDDWHGSCNRRAVRPVSGRGISWFEVIDD